MVKVGMNKVILLTLMVIVCGISAQDVFSFDFNVGSRFNKSVRNLKEIKTENIVKQTLDYSCGPASIATLLSYYFNDNISEEEVIKYLLVSTDLKKVKERKGFSLLDLKNFAQLRGYNVVGYRMDLEYLVSLDKPVLIPINIKDYSHFVIFRGLKGDRVFLADPALGKMTMKVARFLRLWRDGIGLVVTKSGQENQKSPLKLTEEEKAIFADPAEVRKIFGMNTIGNVYGAGEF
jgi:predicted double-glycine peptidase